jgi:uncharacterized repeat protein (TIGR03843 family)
MDSQPLTATRVLTALSQGDLETKGVLPWGSNYAFLVYACHEDLRLPAVYKPRRGERPLWDFPDGTLYKRETAAYVVSEALGWGFVPPTVARDGDEGPGSVQFFVDVDPEAHYFNMPEEIKETLKPIVAFDIIANNADRKGGHILRDSRGEVWGIDHGLCFHSDPKLRTVVWDFAGQPIPDPLLEALTKFRQLLRPASELIGLLGQLLDPEEITALRRRTERLMKVGCFPSPGGGRNYPWPPL